jgi:hypothetical protein
MKIGKYEVTSGAIGTHADGFQGHAHLTWDEGGATMEQDLYFDKTLPTMGEAIAHANEQVYARVMDGRL